MRSGIIITLTILFVASAISPARAMGGSTMETIHSLFENHDKIQRNFTTTPTGIVSYTRSSDPKVAAWIQAHVAEMAQKVESGKGRMRHWDPIFAALWAHVGEIEISYQAVADGVKVSENAKSAEFTCAAQIIQYHAATVSKFVKNGFAEMHVEHPAPPCAAAGAATGGKMLKGKGMGNGMMGKKMM